ncbi:MAG: formylglycine-generating enzyme family protein [Zetaproteobacteria bacterium]|nr:MAG: formylglycine-generating enzyme family protein [Zetaproteobacteria bacterium]
MYSGAYISHGNKKHMNTKFPTLSAMILFAFSMLSPSLGMTAGENSDHQADISSNQTERLQHPRFGDKMTEPVLGMQFVYIEPGSFVMGSPESELNRYPDEKQHKVQIKSGFWMGKYEVTFEQYDAFAKATHHAKPLDELWGRGKRPVIDVKWFEATDFARWLSKKSGYHYRLPTEAEWEYAARAGTTTAYSWGDNPSDFPDYAWNTTNANNQTHPVGLKKPNPWGLYDMHGNVWEWTASTYAREYDGSELKGSSQKSKALRSVRGGSWYFYPKGMRSADRRIYSPWLHWSYIGFRLVRDP